MRNVSIWHRLFCLGLAVFLTSPVIAQQDNAIKSIERDHNGLPKLIVFNAGSAVNAGDAQKVLHQYLPLGNYDDMILKYEAHPKAGIVAQRYQQWYKGYPVAHGSFTIVSKNGNVSFMNGRIYPDPTAGATNITITEASAFTAALAQVNAQRYRWQDDGSAQPVGSLVWVEDFSGDVADGRMHLAWKFDIYASQPIGRKEVFVDAQSGKILFVNNRMQEAAGTGVSLYSGTVNINVKKNTSTTWRLEDTVRGGGIVTKSYNNGTGPTSYVVTSTTTAFTSSTAVDAHWGAEMVYDYWLQKHNRHSVDDGDIQLLSYVHYDVDYDNAFWDGDAMNYGDGSGVAGGGFSPMTSLDICGHEMGHGICQYTCDLIYHAESGAMNEGLSDIWGATIEHFADPLETDAEPKDYWGMGEEVGGGTPLRVMNNPHAAGNPDTYMGTYWVDASAGCTTFDNCGVHTNSGLTNYWHYLTVTGGSGTNDNGDAYVVSGLGFDTTAEVVYLTELSLSSTSEYIDFRNVSIAAAGTLYGDCSQVQRSVDSAWYAVGIGDGYVACVPMITFVSTDTSFTEDAGATACHGSHVVNIPIDFSGPAASGGDPTATITVTGGTAVAGVDFDFSGPMVLTFPAGSVATQYAPVTIYDNGAKETDKTIVFGITIDAAGSDATTVPLFSSYTLAINNDDVAPDTGSVNDLTIGTSDGSTSNKSSAFRSDTKMARTQFLLLASDLTAAGVMPGIPLTSVSFDVTTKGSTQPFSGYSIKLKNTTIADINDGTETGMTEVFNGDVTTVLGLNTITFTSGYVWDGTSNLMVEVCYTNATAGSANDKMDARQPSAYEPTVWVSSSVAADGCSLDLASGTQSPAIPIMHFGQVDPATPVEGTVSSTRDWEVSTGKEVYFYSSTDNEAIAGIKSSTADLGCVNVNLNAAGTGFVTFSFAPSVNRSVKEFTVTPTTGAAGTDYNASFFFKASELAGADLTNVRIVKTEAATDADINTSNTVIVTPTMFSCSAWTSFSGNFTGFSRFFLVDNDFPLGVNDLVGNGHNVRVTTNPFSAVIGISYQFNVGTDATLRLMDMSGRLLSQQTQTWQAGQATASFDVSRLGLANGTYLLQIVTPNETVNTKVTKQ